MSFDLEPDDDIHGECAAEIRRLQAELAAIRSVAGRPVEPTQVKLWRVLYKREVLVDRVVEVVDHIDALSRYADQQADLARRNQEDAERYRWWMRDDKFNALAAMLASFCASDEPLKPQMDAAIDAERKS